MKWLYRLFRIGKALREVADVVDEIQEAQGIFEAIGSIPQQLRKAAHGDLPPEAITRIAAQLDDYVGNGQRILREAREAVKATVDVFQ